MLLRRIIQMREILLEIVKHTGGLGFIETVKITDLNGVTKIEAMDNDKSVIVKGELVEPLEVFNGEFGMRDLSTLKGLVEHPSFKTDNSKLIVNHQADPSNDDVDMPVGLTFSAEHGPTASYRFMNAQMVPNQATFKGTTWDVTISPSSSNVAEFASFAQLLSGENLFMVDTDKDNLRFHLGNPDGTDHSATLVFADNIEGSIKSGLYWPTSQVLSILKLAITGPTEMQFSARGAMMITANTELASWQYILPARKR
jgi:hypothetical protein